MAAQSAMMEEAQMVSQMCHELNSCLSFRSSELNVAVGIAQSACFYDYSPLPLYDIVLHRTAQVSSQFTTSLSAPTSAMTRRVVKLTVVNDFVCPNCCIGQHELLTAISHCTDTLRLPLAFELEHMPFRLISTDCLSDDIPSSAKVDKGTFFTVRLGKEKFATVENFTSEWATKKGIPLSFRGPMSQSTRAHRLAQKAYQVGGQKLQLPVLCNIFKANLQDSKDIGDDKVLADIAVKVGLMSKEEALNFLKSDELEKEVNDLCDKARKCGITGVPVTIIDGRWTVNGGMSSDVFVQIFKKLAESQDHPPPPASVKDLCT